KALAFEFKGSFKGDLTVMVVRNDRLIGSKNFSASVPAKSAQTGWQSVVLPLSAFKGEDGTSPDSWEHIDKVNITGTTSNAGPPCFRGFRWVDESLEERVGSDAKDNSGNRP
ncbi:MAG: hypothetical protein ACPL7K_09735, partial [Armatimonadota bacterium]